MVDKINGQKYYEYAKINQANRKNVDSPEFHLDAEQQGVIYEKSKEKKKGVQVEAAQDSAKAAQENIASGVKVEISHQGREKAGQDRARMGFPEQIRRFAQTAITFLKSLWDQIWNEPAPKGEADFPEILEEHIGKTGEEANAYFSPQAEEIPGEYLLPGVGDDEGHAYTKEEIRAIFRRGNRQEIENFLSDNGKRHLVKNSDLLTQYDRTGSIVGVDRSDKELILHGSKNEIKL